MNRGPFVAGIRARIRVLAATAAACASASCGEPPAPATPPPAPPPAVSTDARSNARYGTLELPTLPGIIALYDADRWRATTGGSFTVLEHAPSRSTLALRVWRAARLVRPAECEAEARLVRPALPRPDPDAIVDSRSLEAPEGFSGSLVIGVDGAPRGDVRGYALAVGAAVGRCFVLAFETTAEGVDAASTVGERLRAAVDRIAPSVRLREVDQRVQPERELK